MEIVDRASAAGYVPTMTLLLPLLLAGADARFESAGVRVGDVLLRGPLLEIREGALVSGNVVEPIASTLRVEFDGLRLLLEPGVRAARDVDGLRLSAHGPAGLRMSAGAESWTGANLLLKRGTSGWSHGETALTEVRVQAAQQEDPEALMRQMEESAQKMRQSSQRVRKPVSRRVFSGGNPLTGSEPAQSQAVRQLAQLSPSGS